MNEKNNYFADKFFGPYDANEEYLLRNNEDKKKVTLSLKECEENLKSKIDIIKKTIYSQIYLKQLIENKDQSNFLPNKERFFDKNK